MQIEFARPHVSDTYPDSLSYPELLWEYWQQSMRRKAREICTLLCLESTWERGCHLEYSIHGKELGSILLKSPDKIISGFSVHTIPDSKRFIKNFHSRERIRMPDSPETCGRKPYPEIKIADLKISKEM